MPKEFRRFSVRRAPQRSGCSLLVGASALGGGRPEHCSHEQRDPQPAGSVANNLMEDVMTRRSFNHTLSPADRITVAKWTRGVAAFYVSITLLTVIGVAVAHYRGEEAQNQIVNLRPHMN
jgi:hypothetical protein